jgi:hypothetical protein
MHNGLTIGYTLLILLLLDSNGASAESRKDESALTSKQVEQAVVMADKARKKAESVGGEWRDVRRLIGKARSAVWIDKLELAMNLAKKAQKQAELGYAQAMKQAEFKMPSYLKE